MGMRLKKLTERQEKFCRNIISGQTPQTAYRNAGYYGTDKSIAVNAYLQLGRDLIQDRIQELRQEAAKRLAVTVESLAAELDKAWMLAFSVKRPEACIQATLAKAKLYGFMSDKNEMTLVIAKPLPVPTNELDLSIEEWQKRWSPKELPPPNGHDKKNGGKD